MTSYTITAPTVECPQCGKHSIVATTEGVYDCLNCGFHKSVSDNSAEKSEEGGSLKTLIGILSTLAMLFLFF